MRLVTRLITWAALAAVFAVAGLILVPPLVGYERYVILTGSMTGTYDPGSIVFDKVVPVDTLKAGDVITYGPPGAAKGDVSPLVTHRIVRVRTLTHGHVAFQTKGDANDSADPWEFSPETRTLPRVEHSVPYVGYVFSLLNTHTGRMLVFAVPALLIMISVLAGLWREAGEAMGREAT